MATKQSRIVIVGGGTFGLSTAYHLARSDYAAVTVLEKGASIPGPFRKHIVSQSLECLRSHPAWTVKFSEVGTREEIHAAESVFDGPMEGWKGYFNRFARYAHAANAMKSVHNAILELGVQVHAGEEATHLEYEGDQCAGVLTLGASLCKLLPSIGRQFIGKDSSVAHIQLMPAEAGELKGISVVFALDLGFFCEPDSETGLLKICPSGPGYTNFIPEVGMSVAPEPLEKSVDSDFVLDAVPGKKGLFVASGDSGHAFKMFPIVGNWIKELLEKERQDLLRWKWIEAANAIQGMSWMAGACRPFERLLEKEE
ncbi:nucleotide-binding domain-containing protein [Thozetella sp. PMI_491]|nr:nucleotide-binding domain-containing protein [Thozetella sp. PMI_491]